MQQYYNVLHVQPAVSYRFYLEPAVLSIIEPGVQPAVHMGQRAVHDAITRMGTEAQTTDVQLVHTQITAHFGLIVHVDGTRVSKTAAQAFQPRRFVQTFFLSRN